MISNIEVGKRLRAIYADWKKDKVKPKDSMQAFADTVNVHRTTMSYAIHGKLEITIQLMCGIRDLGYSLEWLLFRDGRMKHREKPAEQYIDAKTLMEQVHVMSLLIQRKNARMAGIEKELEDLKEDVLTLKSMLTRLAPTDKPLTNTKHIS